MSSDKIFNLTLGDLKNALEISNEFIYYYLLTLLIVSSLIGSFVYLLTDSSEYGLIGLFSFFILMIIVSYILSINIIRERRKKMEKNLPIFLELFASSLNKEKGFMTSLITAAKPEFGFFSEKIKNLTRKVLKREDIPKKLRELNKLFASELFEDTINIIESVLKQGKTLKFLSKILERRASDLRDLFAIRKEMERKNRINIIFIYVIIGIILPLILSSYLNYLYALVLTLVVINSILGSIILSIIKYNEYLMEIVDFLILLIISLATLYLGSLYL